MSTSKKTIFEAIEEIIAASDQGRGIVPLIGAGFSAESGVPPLSALTQYLAKVQFYIREGLFRIRAGRNEHDQETGRQTDKEKGRPHYQDNPSNYLRDFGWPEPNQLEADLWEYLLSSDRNQEREDFHRLLDQQIQKEFIEDISRFDKSLADTMRKLVERRDQLFPRDEELKDLLDSLWGLKGNWKSQLAYLTHANPDYIDTLFQQLVRHRPPGTSHRFLTFLTSLLSIRLFLTTNFDDLLEEALRLEGFHPFVYEVSRDSPLPHPSLVQQELSVVKLHGGTFGLRVGESLDYPLDEDSKVRLEKYLPNRPVLLVMGLGGWDRRIIDLVELVARGRVPGDTIVYWLHFEPQCPDPVEKLVDIYKEAICPVRTQDPGAFLLELYSRITSSHPMSFQAYSPHVRRPLPPIREDGQRHKEDALDDDKPIQFFEGEQEDFGLGASLELARFASRKASTHIPIWIDLEAMHTITDVVVEIFRQLRNYDTSLSPVVLPAGTALDDEVIFEKPIRRIYDALSRGRYLLAFDSVGSFGRLPTAHHSVPITLDPDLSDKEKRRRDFLLTLFKAAHRESDWGEKQPREQRKIAGGPLKGSILAFSADLSAAPPFYKAVRNLDSRITVFRKSVRSVEAPPPRPDHLGSQPDALLLLSAFRRRPSIVAIRQLLPRYLLRATTGRKYLSDKDLVDAVLANLEEAKYLVRSEDGSYWMSRKARDHFYSIAREGTGSSDLIKGGEARLDLFEKLSRLAAIHDDLAEYYLSHLFAASQDLSALLEHLYHRISALRYYTKLARWPLVIAEARVPPQALSVLRRFLGEEIVKDGCLNLEYIGRERVRRLLSLRQILERERERLLSGVSADMLVDWIDWIQTQDLPRLRADLCLDRAAHGRNARHAIFQLPSGPVPHPRTEEKIAQECRLVWDFLDNLKANILRNRGDFDNCTRLRLRQIQQIQGGEAQASDKEYDLEKWLADAARTDWATYLEGMNSSDQQKLVRYLCDISTYLRSIHRPRDTKKVLQIIDSIVDSSLPDAEWDENVSIMEALRLRHRADQLIMGLGPWEAYGSSLEANQKMEDRCREVIVGCDRGLGSIEWGLKRNYQRYKSYFHSLKGRAYLLLGNLPAAHKENDLSRAGLAPNIGLDREILGASLLRQAECLLVRANHVLIGACFSMLAQRGDQPSQLSVEGRSCLVWHRILPEWKETLGSFGSKPNYELRFGMALWLNRLLSETSGERKAWPERVYEELKSDAAVAKGLSSWEAAWTEERVRALYSELRPDRDKVERIQRLCISNWNPALLDYGAQEQGLQELWSVATRRAGRRLLRAQEGLDRAEEMLAKARRNVEWWACLYQLKAQLQTEKLLLQMLEIRAHDEEEETKSGTILWEQHRPTFMAQIANGLKSGLRAIRQGLDVVLPLRDRASVLETRNPRVHRLVRSWVQLMVCGGYLTREAEYLTQRYQKRHDHHKQKEERGTAEIRSSPSQHPSFNTLWEQWKTLSKAAGFSKLLNRDDLFWLYDQVLSEKAWLVSPYSGGLQGRAFALSYMKGCMRFGAVDALLEELGRGRQGDLA